MRNLLLAVLAVLFTGCAFSDNSNIQSADRQNFEDIQRLKQKFSTITGTYQGLLFDGANQTPVELLVYSVDEKAGNNNNGETVIRPALYARLKTTQIVRFNSQFAGRYFEDTGKIFFTNPNIKGQDDLQSLDLTLQGLDLSGDANLPTGKLGTLSLKLFSREANAPSAGDQNDQKEILRKQFESIAGDYEGIVEPKPQEEAPFALRVRLFVTSTLTPQGDTIPALGAFYHRLDDPNNAYDQSFIAVYKPETSPAQIILVSPASSKYFLNLEGVIQNKIFSGSHTNYKGYKSTFKLQKVQ